jgi:hypothetical protein
MRILNVEDQSQALYQADMEPQEKVDTGEVLGTPKSLLDPPSLVGLELTIGKPQSWSLIELFQIDGTPLPARIAHDAESCDFCLVQMAFSLQVPSNVMLESIRFTAFIHGDGSPTAPIAYDIFPDDLYSEVEQEINVGISPELKFGGIEASLVNASYGIRAKRLEPVIMTTGLLSSRPAWQFENLAKRKTTMLTKEMFMIVKSCPNRDVRVTFEVVAHIKVGNKLWPFKSKEVDVETLSTTLCRSTPKPATATASESTEVDKVKLKEMMQAAFDDGELRGLCFDLGVDYDGISGRNIVEKITELISYFVRQNRLIVLWQHVRAMRPDQFS